jgi:glutamate synthase (NADPH) large chain
MAAEGLYRAEDEHSSCGVGLVVSRSTASPRAQVVVNGIEALKAVWHRGAVDADGKTGDGAGIHVQIPVRLLPRPDPPHRPRARPSAHRRGQVFLPRTDFGAQERCRTIVESEVLRMGHAIYGWRHVPVDTSVLGEKANATRPEIEQILIRERQGHGRGGLRARALRHPPADREGRRRGADPRALPVPRCPAGRSSTRG